MVIEEKNKFMNELQNRFVESMAEFQKYSVEMCMKEHNCENEEIRKMLKDDIWNSYQIREAGN